jgi:hypothetical protein
VGWYCPQYRKKIEPAPHFFAGALDLRPRPDGILKPDKWVEPLPGHLVWMLNSTLAGFAVGKAEVT